MSLGLFIAFVAVFAPLIVWSLKNEERLIALEDKIIEDIRDSRAQARRERNISVVERKSERPVARRNAVNCEERKFCGDSFSSPLSGELSA